MCLPTNVFSDIREGMVGARGFTANYALIITWERMGFGGQPKFLRLDEYERIKRWVFIKPLNQSLLPILISAIYCS